MKFKIHPILIVLSIFLFTLLPLTSFNVIPAHAQSACANQAYLYDAGNGNYGTGTVVAGDPGTDCSINPTGKSTTINGAKYDEYSYKVTTGGQASSWTIYISNDQNTNTTPNTVNTNEALIPDRQEGETVGVFLLRSMGINDCSKLISKCSLAHASITYEFISILLTILTIYPMVVRIRKDDYIKANRSETVFWFRIGAIGTIVFGSILAFRSGFNINSMADMTNLVLQNKFLFALFVVSFAVPLLILYYNRFEGTRANEKYPNGLRGSAMYRLLKDGKLEDSSLWNSTEGKGFTDKSVATTAAAEIANFKVKGKKTFICTEPRQVDGQGEFEFKVTPLSPKIGIDLTMINIIVFYLIQVIKMMVGLDATWKEVTFIALQLIVFAVLFMPEVFREMVASTKDEKAKVLAPTMSSVSTIIILIALVLVWPFYLAAILVLGLYLISWLTPELDSKWMYDAKLASYVLLISLMDVDLIQKLLLNGYNFLCVWLK